ncbi:MAG: C45 family autoproteolytic acyltransferase/hydrolase [Ignavibacteriales bacterium]|nr:C45 family autoproteolytic acyltransferase/hydrolase [Ignavibacteriales bacterium]
MKNRLILFCLFVFLLPNFLYTQTNNPLTHEQKSWLSKANRHENNGWIYLHIEGEPRERGFQHGYLLAKEIKESIRVLSEAWKYESAMEWKWLVHEAGRMFTAKVDTENLVEIDGIVEGMDANGDSTSRDEIVALNSYMELIWYWWPTVKNTVSPNSPDPKKQSCSSFIATGSMTADGGVVLGHNTMTDYYYPLFNIILDIHPDIGHRMFMQSCAGFIHSGTDFFVTNAGLVGSETTISNFFPFDEKGVPEFVRMRHATQYASSIDEWCEMMKKGNNGGLANAWLIGDVNTNEIARLELGLKYVGFEKKKDGYFVGSNVVEDLKILRFETKTAETNIRSSDVARRVCWKQFMGKNKGKINLKLAKMFIADHFDTYLKNNNPGMRGLCAHCELDPQLTTRSNPFIPIGTLDGKVVDSKMAKKMSFLARWGSACGRAFNAKKFLEEHSQFEWMAGLLKDRPTQPWTEFRAGEK